MPMDTTSPVATRRGRVAPRCVAWRVTSCTVRYAAVSQFVTANRCRMIPEPACKSPTPSMTAVMVSSARVSPVATPRSMAAPISAGMTA